MVDVTIVGCSGMLPLYDRFLSSCMIKYKGTNILIDCGEGTQMMVRKLGLGFKAIDYLIITHFHCDHISGLPGLLLTIGNSGRTKPLTIIGPDYIEDICRSLMVIAPVVPYEVKFVHSSEFSSIPLIEDELYLTPFEVNHAVQCFGYSFNFKRKAKFNPKIAEELNIPKKFWGTLQKGHDVVVDGKTIDSSVVLGEARKGLKVTYCTDTRPCENLVNNAQESDLFICEGMYGRNEPSKNAEKYDHMTIYDAAKIATRAQAKELWLTHYSPAMKSTDKYLGEMKELFPNVHFSFDGMTKTLKFD